jgi:hypothetical protein
MKKNDKKKKTKLMTRQEIIEFLHELSIDYEDYDPYQFGSGSIAKLSDFVPIAWDTPY